MEDVIGDVNTYDNLKSQNSPWLCKYFLCNSLWNISIALSKCLVILFSVPF